VQTIYPTSPILKRKALKKKRAQSGLEGGEDPSLLRGLKNKEDASPEKRTVETGKDGCDYI